MGRLVRRPVAGGDEEPVLEAKIHANEWTLWNGHLIYIDRSEPFEPWILSMDLETRTARRLTSRGLSEQSAKGISVSPEGGRILFTRQHQESDIVRSAAAIIHALGERP